MAKKPLPTATLACIALIAATVGSAAQDQTLSSPGSAQNGGAGARSGHITSTGETVPNPGGSQSAGTTPLDRGVQNRDNQIDSSICKGC